MPRAQGQDIPTVKIELLKGKIHKARLTQCLLDYEGSLAIDLDLLEQAGIHPYEKLLVVNITNGERLWTYAIEGERGSGVFCLNGAAAHRGSVGDVITIMTFGSFDESDAGSVPPKIIVLDENNQIVARRGSD